MNRLNRIAVMQLSSLGVVSVQNPVVLHDSEPEPDVAILALREDDYASAKPTADDVRLLIEIADSSLEYDREIKLPIYARNGINDFWIVNLIDSRIEVYRQPRPDGTYAKRTDFVGGQALSLLAFPAVQISVDELFS